jgi:hypothetical protein
MAAHAVVAVSRTIKALRRAHFAADTRGDWQEVERTGRLWREVQAAEMEMRAASNEDAAAKLWWAGYFLMLDGTGRTLARQLVRVAGAIVRFGPQLSHLIELRRLAAFVSYVDTDEARSALPRIEAAITWLARPRQVHLEASAACCETPELIELRSA